MLEEVSGLGLDKQSLRRVSATHMDAPEARASAESSPGSGPPGPGGHGRWRRVMGRTLVASLGLLVAGLLGEIYLRLVIFHPGALGPLAFWPLRRAELYSPGIRDPEFWRLRAHFGFEGGMDRRDWERSYDRRVGWRRPELEPERLRHKLTYELGSKRPVLFYGDSFTACMTEEQHCWEGLVGRSRLGESHAILNYGVRGYGLDQTTLMVEATLGEHAGQDPLVLIGILVDDDLDRTAMGLRGRPKPRIEVRGSGLVVHPALTHDPGRWVDRHPLGIRSYLIRALGFGLVPDSLSRRYEGWVIPDPGPIQTRTRLLLARLKARLDAQGLDYGVILFEGFDAVQDPAVQGWRGEFLRGELEALGMPFHGTTPSLLAAIEAGSADLMGCFLHRPGDAGHLSPLGNGIAFEGIVDFIEGREATRPWSPRRVPRAGRFDRKELGGSSAVVLFQEGIHGYFTEPEDEYRLSVRVGEAGPTRVHWDLGAGSEGYAHFDAVAKLVPFEGRSTEGGDRVRIVFRVDGRMVYRGFVSLENPRVPISVELRGGACLTLEVDDGGDGHGDDLMYFASPRFRP